MQLDFYTITFYAMRKKYKNKLQIPKSEQVDYFMESLFVMVIQVMFCVMTVYYDER